MSASSPTGRPEAATAIRLFLCGDVMLGRGIDQVLPHPGDPRIHERYAASAEAYVALAERANGRIPRPVSFNYVWGDALTELHRSQPDVRLVNLETSITTSAEAWPKGINYRMNPANVGCLTAAGIDCCGLANNHVLDWGRRGLLDTLAVLRAAGIRTAGAGQDGAAAAAPAILDLPGGRRLLAFAFASTSSGLPTDWAAGPQLPGVNLLADLSPRTARLVAAPAQAMRRAGDIAVASIHWGGNWGYHIPADQRAFAHALIDGGFDIVHGHSSHHPKAIEVYRGRPVLYGCGDFLNDYEGITGYEEFRGDLAMMYVVRLAADGELLDLALTPLRIRTFRLERAPRRDADWLGGILDRESAQYGTRLGRNDDDSFSIRWR
jgi:poly-gamma-glutamate capsule biosynthesis protein CapA/YwtB (metallophosphatase superfamily)